WTLTYAPKRTASEEELVDELEAKIEETLRLHLVSDLPVGAFLSGGMDSSLLVAMLAKKVGVHELPTFTMGIEYAQFDEAPEARRVAEMYRTAHHEGRIHALIAVRLQTLISALVMSTDLTSHHPLI